MSKEEDDYAAKESPPGQASFGLISNNPCSHHFVFLTCKQLKAMEMRLLPAKLQGVVSWISIVGLPNTTHQLRESDCSFNLRPAYQPGQPGFAEDAPPELMRARASQFM